jgi:hypothetical protein
MRTVTQRNHKDGTYSIAFRVIYPDGQMLDFRSTHPIDPASPLAKAMEAAVDALMNPKTTQRPKGPADAER